MCIRDRGEPAHNFLIANCDAQIFYSQFVHKVGTELYLSSGDLRPRKRLRLTRVEYMRVTADLAQPRERRRRFYVATPLGFEPRITPPKGAVLPLHHGVCRFAILDWRFWIKAQSAKSGRCLLY